MPYTQQWNLTIERKMPFASAFRASYTGNRGIGLLRYALDNLPVHDPVNGVLVANHPNNPANLRGQVIRLASDFQCAGTTGTTAAPFTAQCPVVVPIGALEYTSSRGCRCAPTPGWKLANAFGVFEFSFKLKHYGRDLHDGHGLHVYVKISGLVCEQQLLLSSDNCIA